MFRDVVGHRRLVSLLARSIRDGSLPPSLIFAGPSGVGKRLLALATAQAVNCPNSIPFDQGIDACGVCPSCTRIARAIHPDVLIVSPTEAGSIKIDQVRDILERVAYRPFEGKRRVVVIDEADALGTAGQNALLKTLEEPPSSSMFILVTAKPDTLLPTVRSRCPILRFAPLDAEDVAKALMTMGRAAPEAHAVAATADGSLGRALEASAGDLTAIRELAAAVLAQAAGGADRLDAARSLVAKTTGTGTTDREKLAAHLKAMASLLRDVELIATDSPSESLANADMKAAIARLTPFRGERGVRAFFAIDRALDALERNAGVKIVADWLVFQL